MRKRLFIASLAAAATLGACTSTVQYTPGGTSSASSEANSTPTAAVIESRILGTSKITEPIPAQVDPLGGISVGKDLRAGTSTEGATKVRLYSDPYCPYCVKFHQKYGKKLEDLAKEGKITLIYQPNYRFQDINFSTQSLQAIYWVASHQPDKFVTFYNALYDGAAPKVTLEKREEPSLDVIYTAAQQAGISEDQITNMKTMVEGNAYKTLLEQTREQFLADGFKYIPALMIDDQAVSNFGDERFEPIFQDLVKGKVK